MYSYFRSKSEKSESRSDTLGMELLAPDPEAFIWWFALLNPETNVKFQILFQQQKDKCKHLKFVSSECCIDLVYFVISVSYIQLKKFSGRAPIFQR